MICALGHVNYVAVAVASVLFFILGSVWFSFLFQTMWTEELRRHNVIIITPSASQLYLKMVLTFLGNLVICLALACLVSLTHSTTAYDGLMIGLSGAAIAAAVLASVFIWENRSVLMFLLDVGYPVVGILMSAIILALWR